MDKNDPVFQEFIGYWRLSEEMIAKATKNEVAEVARILAMQSAHYARKYGELQLKAEMLAACRTAGLVQRSTGISGDAVSNCVKNVERTGASEKEKARQLATCHGGDVQPEPPPPPKPRATTLTSCDRDGCWDNLGVRYNKVGNNMIRSDGKACQTLVICCNVTSLDFHGPELANAARCAGRLPAPEMSGCGSTCVR